MASVFDDIRFNILGDTGDTSKDIDKLAASLKNVAKQLESVRASMRASAASASGFHKATQSITLDKPIKAVTRFDRGILGATRSLYYLQRAFYTLKRAGSSLFSFAEGAMAFGETINLFETSLRKIGKEADDALEFR